VLIFYIYYTYLQNPSFPNKKPFNKRPKGLLLTGSPYWKGLELFTGVTVLIRIFPYFRSISNNKNSVTKKSL
jgi:hypothetical protein